MIQQGKERQQLKWRTGFDSRSGQTKHYKTWDSQLPGLTFSNKTVWSPHRVVWYTGGSLNRKQKGLFAVSSPRQLVKSTCNSHDYGNRQLCTTKLDVGNNLIVMFWRLQARVLMFINRLRACWPKGYQRGSLGKSHKNGDYLKQAMRKSYPPTDSYYRHHSKSKLLGLNSQN